MNLLRMNALLVANRESPHPFDMGWYVWEQPCGTPSCLLGQYGARSDLQDDFWIDSDGELDTRIKSICGCCVCGAMQHFDLSDAETNELFSGDGCGGAGSNRAAAIAYVEAFIARKLSERPPPDEEPDEDEPEDEPDEEEITA